MLEINNPIQTNHRPVTLLDQHILNESLKHDLDFHDLYYATLCIEAKYKGQHDAEQYYAQEVINHSEQLWHEAYYCALFHKTNKLDKWKHHMPNMKDVQAVRQTINRYNKP